jgi:hypothetical protein
MLLESRNGAAWYQFDHLAEFPEIDHGIFLRSAGISAAPFDRLNVSFSVGDEPEAVRDNRGLVARCMGVAELVFARQVHGAEVLVADDGLPEKAAGDALISAQPGKFLAVVVADCQPILIYDPRLRVVANIHSGWRGSIANIAGRTVEMLKRRFGCAAGDLVVGIGPSLGPCCAEFIHFRTEIPAEFWGYRRDAFLFDFWAISRDQLAAAGVPGANIRTSGLCTRCNTDRFFSYRGEKRTGRFPAVIGLR